MSSLLKKATFGSQSQMKERRKEGAYCGYLWRTGDVNGGQTRPSLSLQGWEELGIGTPGSRPQVAWLLLTLLGYPGSSSQQCGRGRCQGVGPRLPGWGGMAPCLCGRDFAKRLQS